MATGKAAGTPFPHGKTHGASDRLASAVRLMPSARAKRETDQRAPAASAVPPNWAANYEGSPSY